MFPLHPPWSQTHARNVFGGWCFYQPERRPWLLRHQPWELWSSVAGILHIKLLSGEKRPPLCCQKSLGNQGQPQPCCAEFRCRARPWAPVLGCGVLWLVSQPHDNANLRFAKRSVLTWWLGNTSRRLFSRSSPQPDLTTPTLCSQKPPHSPVTALPLCGLHKTREGPG